MDEVLAPRRAGPGSHHDLNVALWREPVFNRTLLMPTLVSFTPAPAERMGKLAELRSLLQEKFPETAVARGRTLPAGLAALDDAQGGLRQGVVTEISGSQGCGSLVLHTLLRTAGGAQPLVGLVDAGGSFDLQGCDERMLGRVLCVVCAEVAQAIRAADLLLRDGNLPLVIVDFQALAPSQLRRIAATTWHRFQRLVEQSTTALVILSRQPMVDGARVRVAARNRWTLADHRQRRAELADRLDLRVFARGAGVEWEPMRRRA